MMLQKVIYLFFALSMINVNNTNAQSFNSSKVALENFLVRMYNNAPFEGVKVVSDYDNNYLLSVVLVNKNESESVMNRVAQVKSNRQVSQFLNGVIQINSETIVRTTENVKKQTSVEEITEIIHENAIGYTKAMEVLTTFDTSDSKTCYMFYRLLEEMQEK